MILVDSDDNNLSDIDTISTIEAFNSLLDGMDKNFIIDQITQSIDNHINSSDTNFFKNDEPPKKCCTCSYKTFLYRLSDFGMFLILIASSFSFFISSIVIIAVFLFSYYSVIIMNYVFFISSIISYTMSPINRFMSGDALNSFLSFIQVIIASPLIAFYILYIIKSVLNLGEFMEDIANVYQNLLIIFRIKYKHNFRTYISMIIEKNYQQIFGKDKAIEMFKSFVESLILLIFFGLIGYVSFFIDKCIIIVGSICYIINISQIFGLVIPSYVYFYQILINKKSKPFKYVLKWKNFYKNWEKFTKLGESDSGESSSSELEFEEKEKLNQDASKSIGCVEQAKEIYDKTKSLIKVLTKENDDDDDDKIINDKFIDQIPDDDKVLKKKIITLLKMISDLILAENYLSLYYFSTEIAFDRHAHQRRRAVMITFFILNLLIICYDIYRLVNDYSDYLLSSIIVRFILVPLFSFYNIITVLYHKAKDKTIRYVNYASIAITLIIVCIIVFGLCYIPIYQKSIRIKDLNYYPPLNNITIANEKMALHPICDYNLFGVSAFDAYGYSLSGFDINRNYTIFDNQMKIFFGENYSDHISYEIYELDKYFQFLKFYDSSIDTTIFAFRGYNSRPEIAFQFELFASYYIIPFFEDNVPFLGTVIDYWLSFYTDFLHAFGLRFFENRNLIVKYVNEIQNIYHNNSFSDHDNVIFAGINTGGVIAKVVGTLLYRKSISFISYPMGMDFIEHLFHYSSDFMSYVTNVFNVDGIFSHQDSDNTINIGIDTPLFKQTKFCTSGLCDVFSRMDNVYRTFCTMSETCGRGNQFNYYCLNTIGEKNLKIIRESIRDID